MLELEFLASARNLRSRMHYIVSKLGEFRDFSFWDTSGHFGTLGPSPILIH